jgi:cytochrome P450 family 4
MGIQVNAQLEDSEYLNAVQKYTFSKTFLKNSALNSFRTNCKSYNLYIICRFSLILFENFFSIWRLVPEWIFSLTPKGKEYKKNLKIIHDFTSKVVPLFTVEQYRPIFFKFYPFIHADR